MFEVVDLRITNEEELYETISGKIKEGMSSNKVLSQVQDELNSIEDLEDRRFAEIHLPGAVFGKFKVVFYFDVVDVKRDDEIVAISVKFDYMELI